MSKLELKDIEVTDLPVLAKPWYKSKTMWLNILTAGSAVLAGVVGILPALQPVLTPTVYAVTVFTLSLLNIILRTMTNTKVDKVVKR